MNKLEILKKTKISYENILDVLKNTNLSEELSDNLQKSMKVLKDLYNSTYLDMLDKKEELVTSACCKNCSNNLLISDNIDYSYQCTECDENFYDFEVDINKIWYEKNEEDDKKLNSSFYLELSYDSEEKNVYIGTESSSGAKYECESIGELLENIEIYCYNYLDYGEEYSIEIWETDWHRDAGEGFIYNETFEDYDRALSIARKLFDDNNYASIEILNRTGDAVYCQDEESEEFYFENEKLSCVSKEIVNEYINNWSEHKNQTFKEDKFYCKNDGLYIAVDNSSGDCWVEEFESEKETQDWLLGKDLEKEELGSEI